MSSRLVAVRFETRNSVVTGAFWAAVLGRTLVWDEDEQIAIQAPAGGTKIAWDGLPEPEAPGWNRQRFDLTKRSARNDPALEATL